MEAASESVLMLNWIDNSGVLLSNDYAFLTNLYLEVIHLAEKLPPTPYGEGLKRELLRKSSDISNRIDELEDEIDIYMTEYFAATASEIYEDEDNDSDSKEFRKTIVQQRDVQVEWTWKVDSIEGPLGTIEPNFTYDFSEYDRDLINSEVASWVEEQDWLDIDLDDIEGYNSWSDTIEVEIDDSRANITITVSVSLDVNWDGDDNYSYDEWTEY